MNEMRPHETGSPKRYAVESRGMRNRLILFEQVNLPEEIKQKTIDRVNELLGEPERFMDSGGIGRVYRLEGAVCIKIMPSRAYSPHANIFDITNTVAEEASILASLNNSQEEGVRSPKAYGFREGQSNGDWDAILMEELDAVNLRDIVSGDMQPPAAFHKEDFLHHLEAYFYYLHEEHRIVHGDIAPRNIMVDRQTGMPLVIDFGRAVRLHRLPKTKALRLQQEEMKNFYEEIYRVVEQLPMHI